MKRILKTEPNKKTYNYVEFMELIGKFRNALGKYADLENMDADYVTLGDAYVRATSCTTQETMALVREFDGITKLYDRQRVYIEMASKEKTLLKKKVTVNDLAASMSVTNSSFGRRYATVSTYHPMEDDE